MQNQKILDQRIVRELVSLSDASHPRFFLEQVEAFELVGTTSMARLQEQLAIGDLPQAQHTAHVLAGAAAIMGAPLLRDLCLHIEDECTSGTIHEAEQTLKSVEEEFTKAVNELLVCVARGDDGN